MLALEHQDTEFVLDSLLDTQPVEIHQYWCDMFLFPIAEQISLAAVLMTA